MTPTVHVFGSGPYFSRVAAAFVLTIGLACNAQDTAQGADLVAGGQVGVSAKNVLPGAWQAGQIRRFEAVEGSRRVQQTEVGGYEASEPVVESMADAVSQSSLRSVFESSRWVFFRDGTFEVRSYEGHIASGRLMGRYDGGVSPWTLRGDGRPNNQVHADSQQVSASIVYEDADSLMLRVTFDCTLGDASLGAARMAGGGWGTAWSFQLSGTFELPLERGIHEPGQAEALVLASRPIPMEAPTYVPPPSQGYDDVMANAQAVLDSTDRGIANAKAKLIFDHGFWEFHPNGTFRYTHDPLDYYPLHQIQGVWWRDPGTDMQFSGTADFVDGALAVTMSVEGELQNVTADAAVARLIYRSNDGFARYEYAFEQSYRVDQRM